MFDEIIYFRSKQIKRYLISAFLSNSSKQLINSVTYSVGEKMFIGRTDIIKLSKIGDLR